MKNGHGTYKYADGSIYTGDWVDDHKTGYGDYLSLNGSRYQFGWSEEVGCHLHRYSIYDRTQHQ